MDIKSKLLELATLEPKKIHLKTVDLEVYIKPLSFKARYEIEQLEQDEPLLAMAKLIANAACDEEGNALFSEKEAKQLCDGRADHLLELVQHIYALHFVTDADLEAESKK